MCFWNIPTSISLFILQFIQYTLLGIMWKSVVKITITNNRHFTVTTNHIHIWIINAKLLQKFWLLRCEIWVLYYQNQPFYYFLTLNKSILKKQSCLVEWAVLCGTDSYYWTSMHVQPHDLSHYVISKFRMRFFLSVFKTGTGIQLSAPYSV